MSQQAQQPDSYDWVPQTPRAREAVAPEVRTAVQQQQFAKCPTCHGSGFVAVGSHAPQQQPQPQQAAPRQQATPQGQSFRGVADPVPARRGFGENIVRGT